MSKSSWGQPSDQNPNFPSDQSSHRSTEDFEQMQAALAEKQRRLINLINTLPGIVFACSNDPDHSMTYLSEGCLKLTGYRCEELTGLKQTVAYNDITHPEDLPHVLETIDVAIAHRQPYIIEYRIRTKSGEEKWLWEKGNVVIQNDQVIALEGFITDITELKQAEQALRQSEAKNWENETFLWLILNNIPQHIFWKDQDSVYRGANQIFAQFAGFDDPQAIIGKTDDDLWSPDLAERYRTRDRHIIETDKAQLHIIASKTNAQGQTLWQDVNKIPIHDAAGKVIGILGTLEDITERQLAEMLLANQKRVLEMIATHRPLPDILEALVEIAEVQSQNTTGSILLLDGDGLHLRHGADPHLSVGYIQAIDGLQIGEKVGSCGTAAYRQDTVIVKDIASDPLWEEYRGLALQYGLQACWSMPIFSSQGQVLGTFAMYYPNPRNPNEQDLQLLKTLTQLAGIAIERNRAEETLAKREQYLLALVEVQRLLIESENIDELYSEILERLGQASGASRIAIYENHQARDGQLYMSQRAEWCAEGICRQIDDPLLQNLPYAAFAPEWLATMAQGKVHNSLVKDLPQRDRQFFERQGVLSILELPLIVDGQLFGFIGFDNCVATRLWEPLETELLRAAAAAIALAQERYQTREAIQQAEAKYRSIFENALEGIFRTTLEGRYQIVNPMLAKIYGYDSPADLMTHLINVEQQLYVDPHRRLEFIQRIQEDTTVWGFESQIYRKDGSIIWISECARAIRNSEGQLIGYEGTVEDITLRKQTEAELLKRDDLLQGVAEAANCLLTTPDLAIAIPQALAILGKAAKADRAYVYENYLDSKTGQVCASLHYEWTHAGITSGLQKPHCQSLPYGEMGTERWYEAFLAGQSVSGIARHFSTAEQDLLSRDQILSILMVPIFVDDRLWGYIGFDDCHSEREWRISETSILVAIAASLGGAIKRQHTEDQMRHQAFHDALTGLPNRVLFDQRLSLCLAHARRSGELLGVLFLDLDRFKTINDTLGHAIGDQLLQQATQRLTTCLREEDTIARWGGDEFTIILPHLKSPEDAAQIAQRIARAFKPAFRLDHHDLYITSSIGIALYPNNGIDAETLVKNADAALYRAKEQGRNNYQFYSISINPKASELLTLENSLHHALENDEFVIYYQPQINIKTGKITQMEALLRWHHPRLGLVSPATFIGLAEENGLIIPLGEWVLRAACTQNKAWQAMGISPIRIAVNLSARQFQQPNLLEQIQQILSETQLNPCNLELEITETAAMQDVEYTTAVLHALRKMGIRISMDDFGAGYSSLGYLKKFPLHTLKIDRSFVQDLADSPDDLAIISAIITLGQGLNLNVVAEGVETQAQLEQLRSLNCVEMQGFWFSQPLDVKAATQFLKQQTFTSDTHPLLSDPSATHLSALRLDPRTI